MDTKQLTFLEQTAKPAVVAGSYRERLVMLLSSDLSFHDRDSSYASHNFHSFPAKFPPQLPSAFIQGLTEPGDIVLDPMMGSGTTVVEAYLSGRQALGFDIDPLALLLSSVKVTPIDVREARRVGNAVLTSAKKALADGRDELLKSLQNRWDSKSREFVDYWFDTETQIELLALRTEIEKVEDQALRAFLDLAFSAIIITKNGGVSLSLDLAHTRPHRAKIVHNTEGELLIGEDLVGSESRRIQFLTKTVRSPLEEFGRRLRKNLQGVIRIEENRVKPNIRFGDAQAMPLDDGIVDLIVTSPPYASNAIDYMRAHKFSLVWMGYPIWDLGQKRKEYIGGEATAGITFEALPTGAQTVVDEVAAVDAKRGRVLHRYYSEMTKVLSEMYRVLGPGRAAVIVVGNSIMRGIDTRTDMCLAEIGQMIGFETPRIGVRKLDRNRRMMPAGNRPDLSSQIQQRMHEEYVIGYYKPVL